MGHVRKDFTELGFFRVNGVSVPQTFVCYVSTHDARPCTQAYTTMSMHGPDRGR